MSKRGLRLKFAGEANKAAETALRVANVAYQKLIQSVGSKTKNMGYAEVRGEPS